MTTLGKKAFLDLGQRFLLFWCILFISAGDLAYWEAWIFLTALFLPLLLTTIYLLIKDPKLLERRLQTVEHRHTQKIITGLLGVSIAGAFVLSALDHRYNWSALSQVLVAAGDVLVIFGLLIMLKAFKENTFASSTIEVHDNQKIVSTGSYSIVRHPMYTGGLICLIGVPMALGSVWGMMTAIPNAALIGRRALDEERFLAVSLSGYAEYLNIVRFRLVPFIW